MNLKLIVFSSLITAIIGAMLGFGVGKVFGPKYSSQIYQNIPAKYAVVGGVAGFIIGGCQESIRQLKKQRDEEEAEGSGAGVQRRRGE
ncbi:hypothetical protein IQ264_05635 [Phormidium sp. LEGE 05292]|uniref:hypothetical protein n=1 Tax=[Phormidium] sp. LEGE 05292 TaxID=767427 RepID=UPI00187E4364|nr:hypothetical protein [Phormidium sp. LEGE 05292]MBE9224946.1 hypothetical protein [Phormidium sp. LEGE 05292]